MQYKAPDEQVLEQLRQAVPGRVYTGDAIKEDYAHDEMPIYGTRVPDAVVEAKTTEEVSSICRICYENDIPIIPRGAGTGLSGGCVALYGGVVLDTSKMNKILSYDLDNFIVRVQAGVLLNDLAADCLAHGVMYPPDPGEKFATVGGNVSTNAGGMRAVKYGTTRDYVRAMTVVLPSGEILHLGGEVTKNCSGYNLLHLMVGSEGTLGIITELSLRVIAPPANDIERFLGKNVYPKKIEGVEVQYYLLTTFDCRLEVELDDIMEHAAETFVENGALDVVVYDTPEALRSAWAVRGATLEALLANFNQTDECDIVVPVPQIAPLVEYLTGLEEEVGLTVRATGHAGDGNVHVNVCANDMPPEEFEKRAEKFMKLAYAKVPEFGGLISGEHGIGSAKVGYLEEALGQTVMDLMRSVKKVFDPKMLLNPGKVCTRVQ